MIYITGDTHGDSSLQRFYEAKLLPDIEYLIVAGDFGYVYNNSIEENKILDELNNIGYKILWVEGNHENFYLLNNCFKEIDWNDGKVHLIRDNILHLKRGEVFNINGFKIFTFGGAKSVDMLEKMMTNEWFEEELPTKEEMDYGIRNLEKHNYSVDYIVTHTCDNENLFKIIPYAQEDRLSNYFSFIKKFTTYKTWYFGHLHWNYNINEKHKCLYENILPLGKDN